jgi:hypothetical protein
MLTSSEGRTGTVDMACVWRVSLTLSTNKVEANGDHRKGNFCTVVMAMAVMQLMILHSME